MHPDQYCVFQIIKASIFATYIFWKSALGTSCPDARRADSTNNSRFYYCIDIPFSAMGHVWIPATCNYGLVFHPLLKMCVLPPEIPCSKETTKPGSSNNYTFEEKDIESPNTAPDAAALILNFLHNSGNLYHQTLQTTTSTNTGTSLLFSTQTPHVRSTNNQTIWPRVITYQGDHEKPLSTVTPPTTRRSQTQQTSTTDGASDDVNNSFSTSLMRSQWNPALNIPCTTGVRMPNFTDCTRYYMCNSTSGTIRSYACPPNMAFNVYKHVCETSVYNWCKQQTMIFNQLIKSQPLEETTAATTQSTSPCSKPGKIPDPHSRQHYFVCYIESNKTVSYRMACPNKLEYCESDKMCKTQNDCYE